MPETKVVNGRTYNLSYLNGGMWLDEQGRPEPGYASNVTGYDPSNPDPNRPIYDYNETQFADQPTADYWANQLGGQVKDANLDFFSRSEPERLINFGNRGGGMNAGLVADVANRYDTGPADYGSYELATDKGQATGAPITQSYNQWATAQPSFQLNSKFANSGPGYNFVPDGQGGWLNAAQNYAPATEQQAVATVGKGVSGGGAYTQTTAPRPQATPAATPVAAKPAAKQLSFEEWKAEEAKKKGTLPPAPSYATTPPGGVNRQTDSTGRASVGSSVNERVGLRNTLAPNSEADAILNARYRSSYEDRAADHAGTPGTPADFSQPPSYPTTGIDRQPTDNRGQTDAEQYAAYQRYVSEQGQQSPPSTDTPPSTQPPATQPPATPPSTSRPPQSGTGYPAAGSSPPPGANYPGSQSPAQNLRYNFQGQGNGAYQPNSGVQPFYSNKGEDIQYRAENDRNLAIGRGEALDQDLRNYTAYQHGEAGDFGDQLKAAYDPISQGRGGYSDAEKGSILNNDALQALQLGQDQAQSNYLTDAEQAGISGNPRESLEQLGRDEAALDLTSNNRDAYVRGELGAQEQSIRSGLDSQDANVRNAYGQQAQNMRATVGGMADNVRGSYADSAGNVRNSLDYGENNVIPYLDRSRLGLSNEYNQNYQFGDRDTQDIVDKAGRTVGNQTTADEDRLLRQAAADGNTSPLALQAARNRLRQTGAVHSADAMTDARIQARQLALQTAQNRENTRLGAEQNFANLGTGTELALGGRRTAAEQGLGEQAQGNERYLGEAALGTEGTLGAAEIGAESYLGNQRQQAEQFLGSSRTGNEQTLGAANTGAAQWKAGTNLGAFQKADDTASQRANAIATNRQATGQRNQAEQFDRGQYIYGQGSAANKGFADTRLGQEAEYRNYLGNQGTQASQAAQIGNQQRINNFGTQAGAQSAATGNAIRNYAVPGLGMQIAGLFKYGGKVDNGPLPALVGESGPELVVKLGEYGNGGVVDPYTTLNYPGMPQPEDGTTTNLNYYGQPQRPLPPPPTNPMFDDIMKGVTMVRGVGGQGGEGPNGGYQNAGPGFISQALGLASLFGGKKAAGGAVVNGPSAELVTEPQFRTLGAQGPEAVIPMQHRKSNAVNLEDLPELVSRYGSYGRA